MAKAYLIFGPALVPVLWAQGLYVRRVTPRLPEPPGARHGIEGAGLPLRLLIVGDSAAAGVGVQNQTEALAGQLVARLTPHFRLSWRLIAGSGLTLSGILQRLEKTPLEGFDVAVVSAGVNDVVRGTSLKSWRASLNVLCTRLQAHCGVRHALLTSLPPMHVFPALPQPLRWFLGQRALELDRELYAFARRSALCEYARPGFPLERKYIATDGFHPSAAAYAVWAAQLTVAIKQRWL